MKELERLKTALQSTKSLVYEWHPAGEHLVWSGNPATAFNISGRKDLSTHKKFLSLIHKDDLPGYLKKINLALKKKTRFEETYRLNIGNKKYLKIHESWQFVKGGVVSVLTPDVLETNGNFLSGYDFNSGFQKKLDEAIKLSIKEGRGGVYLKISIDNFSLIIGWYNMKFADEIMIRLGRKIADIIGPNSLIKRIYIDQFGILMPGLPKEDAEQKIRDIYELIQDFEYNAFKKPMHLTASLGSVDFPLSANNSVEAVNKAYMALNIARNSNDTFYYDFRDAEKQQLNSKNQTMLMHYIHDAVEQNKICFAYQPMVEAKTGKVKCYECLLRITGDDGSISSPGAIIPIAEKMGFIDTIDQLVLERVIEDLAHNPGVILSFNASSLTTDNPKWLKQCNRLLHDSSLASRIIVEITETAAQRDLRETAYFVASLQALGCQVALDDFGAGYTSFRQLKTLSIDMIKIDGTFIREIANYPDNRLFVKTLLDFTSCYGLKTVAESVEDGESAKILMDMKVDYMQGYYFGAPEVKPEWHKGKVVGIKKA